MACIMQPTSAVIVTGVRAAEGGGPYSVMRRQAQIMCRQAQFMPQGNSCAFGAIHFTIHPALAVAAAWNAGAS